MRTRRTADSSPTRSRPDAEQLDLLAELLRERYGDPAAVERERNARPSPQRRYVRPSAQRRRQTVNEPKPLKTHAFVPSKWRDNRKVRICECGSAEDAAIHGAKKARPTTGGRQ